MSDKDFFESVTRVFDGYPVYSFHLSEFLKKSNQDFNLASKLESVKSEFRQEIPDSFFTQKPDFSIKVEVFLHPKYRNQKLDQNLLVACLPVYNDSLLTVIPTFDFAGNESQIDAWTLKDNQPMLILRIDERPVKSESYVLENEPSLLKNSGIKPKPAELKNFSGKNISSVSSAPWYVYIRCEKAQWENNYKCEPPTAWPPEYYTKTWYCVNSSCTDYRKLQRHDQDGNCLDDWDPPMPNPWDEDEHTFDDAHICWHHDAGWLPYLWRIELWEEDLWAPDDFVDRFFL